MNREDLLVHNNFLQALARSLVLDEHLAADITQDTWAAAIEAAPREDRTLKPWLATVLRNFVRMRHRSRPRRQSREKAAAVPEGIASSAEIVEREETRSKVIEAVLALEEPFRSVVVLRYYQELSPGEAAERLGVPLETMRSRLKKALKILERRLDASFGSRKKWIACLAPIAGVPLSTAAAASTSSSSILAGVFAMSTKLKIGIVSALIIAAAFLSYKTIVSMEDKEKNDPPSLAAAAPATSDAKEEREDLQRTRIPRLPGESEQRPAVLRESRITGRFVDPDGQPVYGVRVAVEGQALVTDAISRLDGRFVLDLPIPDQEETVSVKALCRKDGYAHLDIEATACAGLSVDAGEHVLKPGGNLSGWVMNSAGIRLSGAEVVLSGVDPLNLQSPNSVKCFGPHTFSSKNSRTTRTGPDGSFRIEGYAAGWCRVWARCQGGFYSWTDAIRIEAGQETMAVDLVVDTGGNPRRIEGYVLSPDGEPYPGAGLMLTKEDPDQQAAISLEVDESGRFSFDLDHFIFKALEKGDDYSICLEAYDRKLEFGPVRLPRVEFGSRNVLIRLAPTCPKMEILLSTTTGEPIEDLVVAMKTERSYTYFNRKFSFEDETILERGAVSVPVPFDPFSLRIAARGFENLELGPFNPLSCPAQVYADFRSLPPIQGRVTALGKPLEGARVSLHKVSRPGYLLREGGFVARYKRKAAAVGSTDGQGRFRISVSTSGDYYLRAEKDGLAPADLGPLSIDYQEGKTDLTLDLNRGGRIEGRVIVSTGSNPAGRLVAASRGDGHFDTTHTGADGEFSFENLAPGKWVVEQRSRKPMGTQSTRVESDLPSGIGDALFSAIVVETGLVPDAFRSATGELFGARRTSCIVQTGETAQCLLDLTERSAQEETCLLEGRLLLNGKVPAGWKVMLHEYTNQFLSRLTGREQIGLDGSFSMKRARPGSYRLTLFGATDQGLLMAVTDRVELVPGATVQWEKNLDLGRLHVKGIPPEAGLLPFQSGILLPEYLCKWTRGRDLAVYSEIRSDSGVNFFPSPIPAGPVEVIQLPTEMEGRNKVIAGMQEKVLGRAAVKAGSLTTVQIESGK